MDEDVDTSLSLRRRRHRIFIENFIVIWLFPNNNKTEDDKRRYYISELRCFVGYIQTFTTPDDCVDFLTDIKDEKVFIIMSEIFAKNVITVFQAMPQIYSIYIFSDNMLECKEWTKESSKVKCIFTQLSQISSQLEKDARQGELDLIPISLLSSNDLSVDVNLNELDQSFMYSQLLKEILLNMESSDRAKHDFADFFRLHCEEIDGSLEMINEFERDYNIHSPIWWYTKEPSIYSVLNRALRTQDTEIIIKMGFFIRDLHQQIERCHTETKHNWQNLIVYRGQGMLHVEFEKIRKNQGDLLSFNNFLSTSIDREVSISFAVSSRDNPDLTGILFHIRIDPIVALVPFTAIDSFSYFSDSEKEILFSMHTIFRISTLKQLEDRLWEVDLILTDDNDEQLRQLTNYMRQETRGYTGLDRLGQFLRLMGEFDKAREVYETMIETTSDCDLEELAFIHHQLGYVHVNMNDDELALKHFQQSIKYFSTYLPSDHYQLSNIYNNIGLVLRRSNDLQGALDNYQRSLNIELSAEQPDPQEIAIRHNNIGSVLEHQDKYAEALESFQKCLEIKATYLPSRHPSLGVTYSNIGTVFRSMGNVTNALEFYLKAFNIEQKSLPPDHPSLASTHVNLAGVYAKLGQLEESIKHITCAFNIANRSFGPDHEDTIRHREILNDLNNRLLHS